MICFAPGLDFLLSIFFSFFFSDVHSLLFSFFLLSLFSSLTRFHVFPNTSSQPSSQSYGILTPNVNPVFAILDLKGPTIMITAYYTKRKTSPIVFACSSFSALVRFIRAASSRVLNFMTDSLGPASKKFAGHVGIAPTEFKFHNMSS